MFAQYTKMPNTIISHLVPGKTSTLLLLIPHVTVEENS